MAESEGDRKNVLRWVIRSLDAPNACNRWKVLLGTHRARRFHVSHTSMECIIRFFDRENNDH